MTGELHYKIVNQHASSSRYGPCEVCHQYASEVFHQTEYQEVEGLDGQPSPMYKGSIFGHEECLIARRKKPQPQITSSTNIKKGEK